MIHSQVLSIFIFDYGHWSVFRFPLWILFVVFVEVISRFGEDLASEQSSPVLCHVFEILLGFRGAFVQGVVVRAVIGVDDQVEV